MKVYVALTSWPKRIVTAHETIESIIDQSAHIDGVELNLFRGDFPNGIRDLPDRIRKIHANVPNFSVHFHDRDLKVEAGGGGSKCTSPEKSTGMVRVRPIASRKDLVAALREP